MDGVVEIITAQARNPLPYLFICAFVAKARSFVLPVSSPANLVIYGSHMPPLLQWLAQYSLPSGVSIAVVYGVLRWAQRAQLHQEVSADINLPVGLVAGRVDEVAKVTDHVRSAVLLGVDLGPNLSVTGSLATILWLTVLRREGRAVSA